ncbi:non-ribosomal peptide synthetase, partial [Lysinibacillus sphaericus]
GKLDKKALPEIEVKAIREYVAPNNETEETICKIFSEILAVESVGVKDSFFELGGHSLRATRLVNKIESETGYRIALKDVFSHPTPEKLSQIVLESETEEYIPIPRAEEKEYYAMSSAQKRTYLIQQMYPEGTMYNTPQTLKLTGEVSVEDLRSALQEIVERHEILRTAFLMVNGEAVQKVLETAEVPFEYEEASNRTDEEEMKLFVRAFDLSKAPQIRARFVKRDTYGLFMLDMHHIVGDGMSIVTFMNELNALYKGEKLEPLSHQFKDYSEWMSSRNLESRRAYWLSQFEDEIPVLDLPLDYARPQEQSYEGSITGSILDKELAKKIKALATRTGTTEYMVFLSAAMVLLGKYSRQEDIVIGSPISGRTHKDTEGMLGMFVNTLAMRGRPEKEKRFEDFLLEMKEVCLQAYEHQEYPFEELVEEAQVQRDLSRNPLFDVMLVLLNNEKAGLRLEGTEAEGAGLVSNVAKFDLTFNVAEYEGQYGVMLEYCTALFKEETVKQILKHYEEVLRQVVERQDCLLGEVEMVTEDEKEKILHDFNATKTAYRREQTVVELFEEQAAKTPDQIALVFEEEEVSYRELNERANVLAHKLRELGVRPDDFVAIMAERSIETIAGIYGIIKAGAAYVPIDSTYPEERIEFMLEDCQPKAVLLYGTAYETNLTKIDLKEAGTWEGTIRNPEKVNKAEDLIYCIYTSGTTGTPKGVMYKHQGITNLIGWLQNEYPLDENDVILQKTTFVFDVSASEIFWWSTVGAKLAILKSEAEKDPAEIALEINRYGVTVVNFVPSMLVAFLGMPMQYTEKLKSLKYVHAAGEALNVDIVKDFYEVVSKHESNALLGNIYGPTEASYTTFYNCTKEFDVMMVPIGKPISNTQIYILNGDNLCGIGVPGELCIAGDGLARGYLNRPELTEEKFVKNPFGEGRLYRCGDLARWLPDGNIEYLGRIDEQVKIRGFRIELGEIESRIREITGIHNSAVIAKVDQNGDKALYAYYTGESVSVSEIRDQLAGVLPEYMIPSYMMGIDSIPVTRNGKLDKKALPEIEVKATREYVAPNNEKERKLCEAFCKILNIKLVGIKDSFFELGGDSIKAIRIIKELRNKGYVLAVTDILRGKSIEKIAERMMLNDEIIHPEEYAVKILRQMNSIDKVSDNQIGEAIVLDTIEEYNDNIAEAEIEDSYKVTPMQRTFFAQAFPQICKIIIELGKGFSKEEIQNAVKKVVSEQSVLRCAYNNVTQKINEFEYDNNWKIPYLEEDSHESILEYDFSLKKDASFFKEDGNLSLIIQVKKTNGGHYVMLYIHHGVYDEFSGLIFKDRLDYYLQKDEMVKKQKYSEYVRGFIDTNGNKLYSEQFINSYQESLRDLTLLIEKKNKKSLCNWVEKDIQKSYSAIIEWRMEKELVDKFNEEPIGNFMRLFIEMNPMFAEKEVLPFSLLHHGRTQVDDILMGVHLDLIPGLYEVENNQIIGGLEFIKGDNGGSGPVFDEELYDLTMNKKNAFLVLNYQSIFDAGEYEMSDSTKESIVKVFDIPVSEIKGAIINDVLLFSSPIQSDTKENALLKAEEGLERFKNWLKEKSYISI